MANDTTVVLVGSESLLGREIRDVVASAQPGFALRLVAEDEESAGKLTSVGDEAALVGGLNAESLSGARAVFLAGTAETSRKALALVDGAAVIDLTFAAEDSPEARLRAPAIEDGSTEQDEGLHVIAHPAAIALALFLRRLHAQDPVRRAVIQIFVPASEHGTAGVEELQQQTINLLSFKSVPKDVFDAQLSFSMLAQYGAEAPVALEETELRIERHLATLLGIEGEGEGTPMPSLRAIQAPVFHGYSFSAWVEFESNPGIEALESSLGMSGIELLGREMEPPNNVGPAGQGGIAVGAIAEDRNSAEACWFWIVADNLRLTAENAVEVARQLV
ncbi:MAG TPA: Asd/ArgC dimerization domain-containing protein [Bryobacteraceae bacterium]|nr:Asd/ArgC dimerization domain-containing protein [Bryobacteraceae bacterium]